MDRGFAVANAPEEAGLETAMIVHIQMRMTSTVPTVRKSDFIDSNIYECKGYRLPTQAECKIVALSGETGVFWSENGGGNSNQNFCTGEEFISDGADNPLLSNFVWYCGNAEGSIHPVATKIPNAYGLYDIHGNVSEMLEDHGYAATFPSNPLGPYSIPTVTSYRNYKALRGELIFNPNALKLIIGIITILRLDLQQ